MPKVCKKSKKIFVSTLSAVFIVTAVIGTAMAISNGDNATDLLGQFESDNTTPSYIKSGANNTPNSYGLYSPQDAEVDSTNHRLFVSDSGNNRILVFNLDASDHLVDYNADYVIGQDTLYGVASGCTSSTVNGPKDVLYDSTNDRLFVSDINNYRVMVYDVSSLPTPGSGTPLAADYVLGSSDMTTCAYPSSTTSTTMSPIGLAMYGNDLYVVDTYSSRVMRFDADPLSITTNMAANLIVGQVNATSSSNGCTSTTLYYPTWVAIDSSQKLYVTDTSNSRVMVYDTTTFSTDGPAAEYVIGRSDFTTCSYTGITDNGSLYSPQGLAWLNNQLFVSDSGMNRIMIFPTPIVGNAATASYELGQVDFDTYAFQSASQTSFYGPLGIGTNGSDRLYIADGSTYNRVMIFDLTALSNNTTATNLIGHLSSGSPSYTVTSANDETISALGLSMPFDVEIDTVNHRLFITENTNSRIVVHQLDSSDNIIDSTADYVIGQDDFTTNTTGECDSQSLYNPTSVAIDSVNEELYVVDQYNYRIAVFDISDTGLAVSPVTAVRAMGQSNLTTCDYPFPVSSTTLNAAEWVEYDGDNDRLFVSEGGYSANRVLVFNDISSDTATPPDADIVLGQTNFSNTGSTSSTTGFGSNSPHSLVYNNNTLYVADDGNNRIMVFDVDPLTISDNEAADNVLGQTVFNAYDRTTNGGQASVTPSGLAFISNKLFASDAGSNRVLVFDVATITDGENAETVLGQANFTAYTAQTTQDGLSAPYGLSHSGSDLFVADQTNNRIMVFSADVTPPLISTNQTADLDGDGYIDAMHITFDENIDDTYVAATDFAITGATNLAFSSTTNSDTVDDSDIYITFDDGVLATDAVPTVTYTAGTLVDFFSNALATVGPLTPTDTAGPAILSATASSTTITLVFSESTNEYTIDETNIDTVLALSDSHSWLDGSGAITSATWSDASTLVIVLSTATSNPTIAVGDTITLYGSSITDGTIASTTEVSSAISGTITFNSAPTGLASLSASSASSSTATLGWTAATDTNFSHYEIWYGTSQSDVQGRTGTATEWDNSDDSNLANSTTTTTIITGLTASTTYYFKIWAVDDVNAEATIDDTSTTIEAVASSTSSGGAGVVLGLIGNSSNSNTKTETETETTPEKTTTDQTIDKAAADKAAADKAAADKAAADKAAADKAALEKATKATSDGAKEITESLIEKVIEQKQAVSPVVKSPIELDQVSTEDAISKFEAEQQAANDAKSEPTEDQKIEKQNKEILEKVFKGEANDVEKLEIREYFDNKAKNALSKAIEDRGAVKVDIIDENGKKSSKEIANIAQAIVTTNTGKSALELKAEFDNAKKAGKELIVIDGAKVNKDSKMSADFALSHGIDPFSPVALENFVWGENKGFGVDMFPIGDGGGLIPVDGEGLAEIGDSGGIIPVDGVDMFPIGDGGGLMPVDGEGLAAIGDSGGLMPVDARVIVDNKAMAGFAAHKINGLPGAKVFGSAIPRNANLAYSQSKLMQTNVMFADLVADLNTSGEEVYIGSTTLDDSGHGIMIPENELSDGEYYFIIGDENGVQDITTIVVNNNKAPASPELELVEVENGLLKTLANLMAFIEASTNYKIQEFIVEAGGEETLGNQYIVKGNADIGSTVYVFYQSKILTSAVISDASQGAFELDVPLDELEDGDHEVVAYVYNEGNGIVSNIASLVFQK